MLSVKGVKIYDLRLVNPPPSSSTSDPKFQIKIKIKCGNKTILTTKSKAKKGEADGDSRVVWNESFTFPGDIMDNSQVTFTTIRQRRAGLSSKTVGSSTQLIADLLKAQNDSGSCKLDLVGNCYLTFHIEESSDVVPKLVGEASEALTLLPDLRSPTGAADLITSVVQFYDNQEETWSSFLLKFEAFMKVIDDVSEISPYVKMAWSILSVIPKTIITQSKRNDKVKQLCEKMVDIYDYITDAKRLPELTTTQRKTLSVLVHQTVECAHFIKAYSAESTVKNMVKGTSMDDKIQKFNDKFDHLKQVMTDSVNLETSFVTLRVSEGIDRLNDSTLLDGMDYESSAGISTEKLCFPGTRETLISKIIEWVNRDTSPQILVLSGQAGIGKSAVAHTIAGHFQKQNRLGSIFCFNRSYKDRRNYLFSTVARDLADGDVMWRKELVKAIAKAAVKKSKDPRIQFEELLLKPSQNVSTIGSIVIIVDALDESGDRGERKVILELLFDRCKELPINYRIIVTSRPEQDIEPHFQDTGVLCIRMGDIDPEETYSDIRTYITRSLRPISETLDQIDGDWREILAKRAEGLFQWARTACEFIDPDVRNSQVIKDNWKTCISNSSSSSSFNSPLYKLYHQIISSQSESKNTKFIEAFKTVIGAIIMAREPLSIDALQIIFPNIEDIMSILSPFGSLFVGVHDSSTPVRPLHTSLFDFFTTATENHSYYVDTSDQSFMTRACLRLMNGMLCFNICQLETSHRVNQDVPQFDSRVKAAVPRHLDYSCRFWVFHLRSSPCEEELVREIRYFMNHNLLYWFEVLSLLGTVGQGWVAMQILKNWCTGVDKDLAADALDACDFGYDFEEAMTDSTPHLYLSALSFTPPNSFISKTYLSAYPGLFTFDIGRPPAHSSPRIGITRRFYRASSSALAFDPNGKYIATGSSGGEFVMWDYTTGELAHAYNESTSSDSNARVRDVVFSSDGQFVYCCFENGNILVLDTRTNKTHIESYAEMMGDQDWCRSFTISSNGYFLALSMENKIILYDRRNRSIIEQFDGTPDWNCPIFSPNGEFFALTMNDQVCVWNITRQTPDIVLKQRFEEVNGPLALNDSYAAFVVGDSRSLLEVWDVRTSTKVTEIRHENAGVNNIAFSLGNQYILSSSRNSYFVWNVPTGELISESTVDHSICCLAFSHDCKSIALGMWDGSTNVRQWDTSIQSGSHADVDNRVIWKVVLRDTYLILVYSGSLQYGLQISDITTLNTILFEAELTHQELFTVCPHRGDSDVRVAYVTSRGLCLWDKTTKCEITVYESVHSITALASSNKYLVSADIDDDLNEGIVKIWDIYTRDLVGGPYTISGSVEELCVSATSINFMVAYHVDNDGDYLEVRQCESGHIIGGPFKLKYILQLAFSPDETRIISIHGSSVEIIDVDVSTGRREKLQQEVRIGINSLSPNGKCLARIDDDDRVKLLDTDTGMSLLNISLLLGFRPIYGLIFSNDSKQIIVTSRVDDSESETAWDSEVSVWDIQSGKMIVKLPFPAPPRSLIRGLNLRNGYLVIGTHFSLTVLDMNACEMISTLYDTHCKCNDEQLVDISLKGGWWSTSRTEVLDYALMAWKKAPIPAFATPDIKDGWVRGLKKELLLWIPQKRRAGFWSPCAMHVPYRNITKLNFDNFVHGTRWTKCRNEISM